MASNFSTLVTTTWGIGLLIVTVTAFASPAGFLLVPLLKKSLYERMMTFLVSLGIGALSGSILYVMIPQAYSMEDTNDYLKKSSIFLGALYAFFLFDRLLQYILEMRRCLRSRTQLLDELVFRQISLSRATTNVSKFSDTLPSSVRLLVISSIRFSLFSRIFHASIFQKFEPDPDDAVSVDVTVVEQTLVNPEELQITSFVYMIIFGSSANNFVDGMSNGVAFGDSLVRGLSVGIACIAQQFPQELGTLAILVRSGLGLKRTLLLNLIPGFMSYIGFIIGALLDKSMETADNYVFSVSSGMYSYVFLGTLLPELRDSTNQLIKKDLRESVLASTLQAIGILFGVIFMFCMAKYGEKIAV
ncbi:unnamed protein product [Enterobius vermicularis]|uniref:Zinc/iron permease n=1 Tax=Enterobius vermicularis TaxID=51028 RepID=A0A0N4VCL8_ENTVE|nr:unnamed protein product [Enterobius vermicularis]